MAAYGLEYLALLFTDLSGWLLFVSILQRVTGRRSRRLPPERDDWYTDDTRAGRTTMFFPIGEANDNGDTPILLMTVEANGDSTAERAVWQRRRR